MNQFRTMCDNMIAEATCDGAVTLQTHTTGVERHME